VSGSTAGATDVTQRACHFTIVDSLLNLMHSEVLSNLVCTAVVIGSLLLLLDQCLYLVVYF